jgi:hypothetical protein
VSHFRASDAFLIKHVGKQADPTESATMRAVRIFLALTIVAGCGAGGPVLYSNEAAQVFVDDYCAEVAKCCGQEGKAADGKACHDQMTLLGKVGTYIPASGNACLAETRSEVSAGIFCARLNTRTSSTSSSPCDAVFGDASTGSKKVGESCDFDFNCATPSTGEVGCNLGTCAVLLAAGGACTFTAECVHSAFCDPNENLCVARVAAGSTCTSSFSDECVDGYYCPSTSTQCAAQVAGGAPCTTGAMCQSGTCSSGICQPISLDLCGS